jgi:hypothetical protein
MRLITLLLISACFLAVTIPAWGQAASNSTKPGILGYLDPRTGAFRPVPPPASDDSAELPTATTLTGTVTLTITITVKTSGIANFTCSAGVSTLDGTTSPTIYEEVDTVTATGSGSTRTCKLSIPYSWSLASASTDSMTTSYFVTGRSGATATVERTSNRSPLDSRKVPANGAITALTASVTQ